MSIASVPPPAPPSSGDPVLSALRGIRGALADLADVPVWALDDRRIDARLQEALAAQAAADEVVARIAGEADAAGLAGRAGCSSTRAWLTARHRLSHGHAKRLLAQARAMTARAEATRKAWASGTITGEQAEAIAAALNAVDSSIPAERIEAAEVDLLRQARQLPVADLRRVANRLVEVVDPDSADRVLGDKLEAQEKVAMQQAVFRLVMGVDGVARFGGKIPNLHADMLVANLEALASPRRDHLHAQPADSALRADAHGDKPDESDESDSQSSDPDSGRLIPHGQRLGRAFCEWIEKLPSDGSPPGNTANATVVVTVDEGTLRDAVGTATLSTGGELSVGEVRRLACNAGIMPLVLGGDSVPLDLGRGRRLFTPQQKIALAQRDGGCVFPGCDRPPTWADAHHARLSWAAGGLTDVKDGCLLCGFHHRLVHRADGDWRIVFASDGIPEIVPPERLDPLRRPIRHHRLKPRAG